MSSSIRKRRTTVELGVFSGIVDLLFQGIAHLVGYKGPVFESGICR